jgi:hypothetical protein
VAISGVKAPISPGVLIVNHSAAQHDSILWPWPAAKDEFTVTVGDRPGNPAHIHGPLDL